MNNLQSCWGEQDEEPHHFECALLCGDHAAITLGGCGHKFCSGPAGCLRIFLVGDPSYSFEKGTGQIFCPSCKAAGAAEFVSDVDVRMMEAEGHLIEDDCRLLRKRSSKICLGTDIYCCCVKGCSGEWAVEEVPDPLRANKFKVTCPVCRTHQCCKCSEPWALHRGVPCEERAKQRAEMDPATHALLGQIAVMCPGGCGHGLEKDPGGCNVLSCKQDGIYVCALCGEGLDSRQYNPKDRVHGLANMHFDETLNRGSPCAGHLFTDREVWRQAQAGPSS